MSDEQYLENPYVQHYLEEIDARVAAYLDTRGRGDVRAMAKALIGVDDRCKWLRNRLSKIDSGRGLEKNSNGWNPPAKVVPPKAVRIEEET